MTTRESRATEDPAPERSAETAKDNLHAGSDAAPGPRWCRFAAIYCRCGLAGLESSTMSVCAMHYLDEIEVA